MDFHDWWMLKTCYQDAALSVDQKVQKANANIKKLRDISNDDLCILFSSQLPLAEGLEIITRFGDVEYSYIELIRKPETISVEVQKAFMRICGCLGGFTYERWGIGQKTEAMERHLKEYKEKNPPTYFFGDKNMTCNKIYRIDSDTLEYADNFCYEINKVIGFVLD